MKVLWFNWRDIRNPDSGGAEVYTHEVARRLVKWGHQVTLFTSMFPGGRREEIVDGIRTFRDGGKYTVYLKAVEHYNRRFVKENYDVVIDEINTVPFFTPRFIAQGEKIVALIHQLAREYWFYETFFPVNVLGRYFLEDHWLRGYTNLPVITVSDSTKKDLLGLAFTNIYVVHNGLNVKPIVEPPKKNAKPVVVFVGRMIKAKRPMDVIKAFKIIQKKSQSAELWMIGDGYLKQKLESRVDSHVKFFGHVDGKTRDEMVKKAWAIAVPSIREGWSQVVTDANALGTPAVGYDVSGLRDSIIDGLNGLLIGNSPEALANGIMRIISDNKFREDLSRNAIQWAGQYSWDKTAKIFLKIINNLSLTH